jgi:hypothetical protein
MGSLSDWSSKCQKCEFLESGVCNKTEIELRLSAFGVLVPVLNCEAVVCREETEAERLVRLEEVLKHGASGDSVLERNDGWEICGISTYQCQRALDRRNIIENVSEDQYGYYDRVTEMNRKVEAERRAKRAKKV